MNLNKCLSNSIEFQAVGISSDRLITSSRTWLEVSDVMSKNVAAISIDETVISAAKMMSEKKISCLLVMENGSMAGILTETDVLRRVVRNGKDFYQTKLGQIMSYPVESVPSNLSVLEASKILGEKRIKRLPILKDDRLIGIVTQTDLVRTLTSYGMWRDVSEIMSLDVAGIQIDASIAEAADIMTSQKISCIVVLNVDEVVGVLTEKDLLGRVVALRKDPACVKVKEAMSSPVTSIPPNYSVFSASKIMEEMNIRRLVVINSNRLCGLVTQTDIFMTVRKKLQLQEEKHFRLLEESKSNIYTTDLDGMITYVNPAFMKLLEVSDPEELINQPFLPERFWFNLEERKQFLRELKRGSIESKELALKTSEGKKIYATVFPSITKNIHGEINGSQGIVYDITAKKELLALRKAEEALQQSEERLSIILNSILTGVVLIDAESHKIIDANPLAVELIGMPKEKIVGNICHEFICPSEKGNCPIYDLGQTEDQSERILLRADGKEIPIIKTVTPATWQGRGYFVESFIDITWRKKAEEQIKKLSSAVEQSIDGIAISDLEHKLTYVNEAFARMHGYSSEEMIGMKLVNLHNKEQMDEYKRRIHQITTEDSWVGEIGHVRKDGTTFPTHMSVTLLRDDNGKLTGSLAVTRDITRRKEAEQALEKLNSDLESAVRELTRANKELQEFAYIAAHDLKTPLRAIGILADWLSTDYAEMFDDQGHKKVKLLVGKAKQMSALIDDILQYSRVGQNELEKQQNDLNSVLSEVISGIVPPENIEITVESEMPVLMCQKTHLIQIFQNLISNAVKYMDKPNGQIKVSCVEQDNFWKFSVEDNGPGIDKKHYERIFKIFQTLSPRDRVESTGIGLSIVKKIAELNGGRVWVESEIGKGSTFIFTLPKQNIDTVAMLV